MRKKIFWGILVILAIGVAVISISPQKVLDWLRHQPVTQNLMDKIYSQQYLPGPLRGSLDSVENSQLTRDGVIANTNDQRSVQGLAPLKMNAKLNLAAENKLADMFAQQYFEHESPQGKSPADIIKAAGYDYIIVGENLALGNFINDQALVNAWMNSPGHRANILHPRFQEIGVAVGRGMFQGKTVWLAVQEFGAPLSSCPGPQDGVKAEINNNQAQINTWQADLAEQKAHLEQTHYSSQEQYQKDLETYNALVQKTNALIDQTKTLVEDYNNQVNAFNSCLDKNG